MRRARRDPEPPAELHAVEVHLDDVLTDRGMTLVELAERAGISTVNLSVLKNGRARAVRFSSLTAICRVLDCQPGDLLTVRKDDGRPSSR